MSININKLQYYLNKWNTAINKTISNYTQHYNKKLITASEFLYIMNKIHNKNEKVSKYIKKWCINK